MPIDSDHRLAGGNGGSPDDEKTPPPPPPPSDPEKHKPSETEYDEELDESFPASDPPASTQP